MVKFNKHHVAANGINEARKVLAENGYSMDCEAEKFAAFKAKILAPVLVSA